MDADGRCPVRYGPVRRVAECFCDAGRRHASSLGPPVSDAADFLAALDCSDALRLAPGSPLLSDTMESGFDVGCASFSLRKYWCLLRRMGRHVGRVAESMGDDAGTRSVSATLDPQVLRFPSFGPGAVQPDSASQSRAGFEGTDGFAASRGGASQRATLEGAAQRAA